MEGFRIPLGEWIATGVDWIKDNLEWLLDLISLVVRWLVENLTDALVATPFVVTVLVAALLSWLVRSWQMGVGTLVTFTLIAAMDVWEPAMQLSLIHI